MHLFWLHVLSLAQIAPLQERPPHEVGGASFVQLVTALNLGLLGISQLRGWLDWIWDNLKSHRAEIITRIRDQLKQRKAEKGENHPDVLHLSESVNRLETFLKDVQKRWAQNAQNWIWGVCAFLAAAAFLWGLGCLYYDCFSPWDFCFALPFPVYWIVSGISYSLLRLWARMKASSMVQLCNHKPTSPARLIDEADSQSRG